MEECDIVASGRMCHPCQIVVQKWRSALTRPRQRATHSVTGDLIDEFISCPGSTDAVCLETVRRLLAAFVLEHANAAAATAAAPPTPQRGHPCCCCRCCCPTVPSALTHLSKYVYRWVLAAEAILAFKQDIDLHRVVNCLVWRGASWLDPPQPQHAD